MNERGVRRPVRPAPNAPEAAVAPAENALHESAHEAVAQAPEPVKRNPLAVAPSAAPDFFAAFGAAQVAIAEEFGGMVRSGIAAAADTATAMIGVKSFGDAVEVQLDGARKRLDLALAATLRMGEIGADFAARLGDAWSRHAA